MSFAARLVFLCCAAVPAQTYIVDAANGPGTNFTEIATAVAAVPDGAILIVRSGSYASFTIANKGLSVLCEAGVTVDAWPPVTVTGTSALQSVELRGMHVQSGDLVWAACQGPAFLYNCSIGAYPSFGQFRANACSYLQADNCILGNGLNSQGPILDGCVAVLRGCSAQATYRPGLDLRASAVQLIDCAVRTNGLTNCNAITMAGGDLRIVGGSLYTPFLACVDGVGSARVDPSVVHQHALFSGNLQSSIVEMPAVVTTGGALGANVTATMRGPNGDVGALLVGLPGAPWSYPGIADPIWLLPGSEAVCAFTVFAAGTPLQLTFAIPNVPAMRGMRYCWQGVSYGAANGLQASNPAITTHW